MRTSPSPEEELLKAFRFPVSRPLWLACVVVAGVIAFGSSIVSAATAEPGEKPLTYEDDVRPILKANCFHCHGTGDELSGELDLRLRRFIAAGGDSGPAIVPGKREESLIYERISLGEMPPTEHKLSNEQIEKIGHWIDTGATTKRDEPEKLASGTAITPEDREYWAFQPITRPEVPADPAWRRVRTSIDAFILKRLNEAGIGFGPEADKLTLLKRACFDLTGLPPSEEQLALFMADESPDAYERLIDRLLASPHYGERWARHWLDVAGYADSEGYTNEDRVRSYAYKYRDYCIRAFNSDKPLDQFIRDQLAGDEMVAPPYKNLSPEMIEKLTATGFLRMAADGTATGGIDQTAARNQVIADTIKILSTSLLGLSVGCAQCHDHRYDPILQTDYYRLRAVLEPAYDWKNWRVPSARLISLQTDEERSLAAAIEAEAAQVAAEKNAKQAAYIAEALEIELAKHDVSVRDTLKTAYEKAEKDRTEAERELLKKYPSVNITPGNLYQYNQKHADELKTYDARIGEIRAKKPVEDFVRAMTEVPGQAPLTYLFHRGDPEQASDEVAPGCLSICIPEDGEPAIPPSDSALASTGRRTAYADWLTNRRHPLVRRVLVNRIWMHHFGRGIVGTPSDFGTQGERPTHPELLDYLAEEFVDGGWRLKRLHKLITTSTVYRQSSLWREELAEHDPDDRLYGRMPVRRLAAEEIRDRILTTSGALNRKMFGPAVPVKEDAVGQIVVGIDNKASSNRPGEEVPLGGEEDRRSIYIQVRRSQPLAFLHSFDGPVMETNCQKRVSSTVAPQALMLMNSKFILDQAETFAERVQREAGDDPKAQLKRAWRLAYLRPPTDEEMTATLAFLESQVAYLKEHDPVVASSAEEAKAANGDSKDPAQETKVGPDAAARQYSHQSLVNLCQAILSSNEFLYVD